MIDTLRLISIKDISPESKLKRFDCEIEPLNVYLSRYALKYDELGIGKTFTAVTEDNEIAGYFTLSTAEVSYEEIPDECRLRLPRYPIPALRIARLAVDKKMKGKGIGKWLLSRAFIKTLQVAEVTGLYLIIVDAKDSSKTFYENYGFKSFLDKKLSYFILVDTVRKAIQAS